MVLSEPGDLQDRLDTIIAQYADSEHAVEPWDPNADPPASPAAAAEMLEHSIHRMQGMEIAFAIEYRVYYILSYPKGYGQSTRPLTDRSKPQPAAPAELHPFTHGWLVKKGAVKFHPFSPEAPGTPRH
jgi:hypothetical protein